MIITQSTLGGVYNNFGDYKSAEAALNTAYQLAIQHGFTNEFDTLKERLKIVAQNVALNNDSTTEFDRNQDRKSTRLNSSHVRISYAVFCLKKKKKNKTQKKTK